MDKWIPNYPSNKILHLVHEVEEGWRVSDLIDWDLHWWRRDIIMANFNQDEAKAICRIPLSHRFVEGSLVWLHNKSGVYTVWLGYHLARLVMRKEYWAESSIRAGGQQVSSALWKMKVPSSKIKVFGWRACRDILPTRVNLVKHKIIPDNVCHCCKCVPKKAVHTIWECEAA